MKNLWLIVCLSACSAFASAQTTKEYLYESGNAFLRICSSVEKGDTTPAESLNAVGCMAYVRGFVHGVETGNTVTTVQMKPTVVPMPFCRPDDVENGQLVKVVLKYLRDNPEHAH